MQTTNIEIFLILTPSKKKTQKKLQNGIKPTLLNN